jgi:type II secretory pathway pseudopilin PulG
LIELLVVIGIIAVLAAIVIPVYARAQEKGRQATCISNMHAIGVAIRIYQLDNKGYPVDYQPLIGDGGVSALYTRDYLSSNRSLRCPNDSTTVADYVSRYQYLLASADRAAFSTLWTTSQYFTQHYSTYNCLHTAYTVTGNPSGATPPSAPYQLYNRFGYNGNGLSHLSLANADADVGRTYLSTSIKFVGLYNNWAPDETIVTHCPYHRDYFGRPAAYQDVIVRVGGDAGLEQIAIKDWINQPGT